MPCEILAVHKRCLDSGSFTMIELQSTVVWRIDEADRSATPA